MHKGIVYGIYTIFILVLWRSKFSIESILGVLGVWLLLWLWLPISFSTGEIKRDIDNLFTKNTQP